MCNDCLGKPDREQQVRSTFVVKLIKHFFFFFLPSIERLAIAVFAYIKATEKTPGPYRFLCITLPGVTVQNIMSLWHSTSKPGVQLGPCCKLVTKLMLYNLPPSPECIVWEMMVVYIMHQGMSIPNTLNPRWQNQFLFHPGTGLKPIDGTSFMHAFIVLPCVHGVYHLLQRDVVHSLYMHCLFRACNWVEYSIINSYILVIMTIFCYTFWQAC